MKKLLLTLLLIASLTLGLTACSTTSGTQNDDSASQTTGQDGETADTSQDEEQSGGTTDSSQDEEQSGETADASRDEEQSGETADSSRDEEQNSETAEVSEDSGEDYAVSAISAVNLITSINAESSAASAISLKSTLNVKSASLLSATTLAETVTDSAKLSSLDEYMSIVNGILSDSSYGVANTASDRADYTVKSTLSFADMSGATVEYVMYYNETNVREYTKKNETERRSDINGILIIDGVEYAISGVTESETEGAESEYETRFTVTLSATSYIVITHESEEDNGESEVEYEYSQYENNVLVKRATFSYEQEYDETEIEMSVYENGTTTKFYFEKEIENGVEYTTIKIGSANSAEKYRVYVALNADGTYSYTYTYIGR